MSEGRTGAAVVTGANRGIGRSIAAALAAQGWDVGITWHEDEDLARETAGEVRGHGREAGVAALDLADRAAIVPALEELAGELGGVDALVNNAGTGGGTPFLELGLDEWDHELAVDLTGAFVAGRWAARRWVGEGRGGRIVNVTSVHEHVPLRAAAGYCAAKGGLGLLTKVMALELAEHGILVNAVAPGEIATRMTGNEDEDPATIGRPGIPLGRPGHADEIAAAVALLLGPGGTYVTGASWVIDGGLLLMAAQANQALAEG